MLGTGDHTLGSADPLPLEATDLSSGDSGAEERILPCAFDDAAPAGVAGDVDHGRESPVDAHGSRLTGGDGLTSLNRVGIPGRRHRDRHRENGAEPVDDVEPE